MPYAPVFAVSTWSIHRVLGVTYPDAPDRLGNGKPEAAYGPGTLALLDLPEELKRRGFDRVEICHFQLNGRDGEFIRELRGSLERAKVTLQTLLIDDGDITHPKNGARDEAWIAGWIERAAALGATAARVIAGKQQPTPAALARSVAALRRLGRLGKAAGVRVLTENWFDLTAGPAEVNGILDALEGDVGFLADTGNWEGADKYENLAAVFGRAERCHTKAHFNPHHSLDHEDFLRCLEAVTAGGYDGPQTLIYEGDDDEWRGIEIEREFVTAYYAGLAA